MSNAPRPSEAGPTGTPSAEDPRALDVVAFWLSAGPERWFASSEAFDAECRDRQDLTAAAAAGALDHWTATAAGSLALIILLDQFPRNIHRGTPQAFATDPMALAVADAAIGRGFDRAFPMPVKNFFYLPFMHAEDLAAQERSIALYRATGDRETLLYAFLHHEPIRLFGRFPHRNPILGRASTPDEEAYLASGGFSA